MRAEQARVPIVDSAPAAPATRDTAPATRDTDESTARAGRVPGRKRASNFQRKYAAAVKAIESGAIAPEVKPVSAHVQCSTRTASSILAKAVSDDGRFSRDTRGRVRFAAAVA